jgi:lipopolysaccharide export system permease protein
MPLANKELRVSRINFKNNYASLSFNPKTFEILKDLTIYANERNENNILYGILLHDKRSEDYSLTITAQKGKIIVEKSSVLLYMDSGTLQKTNYQTLKSEILKFDNYVFNLSENHGESTQRAWKAREQYLHELFASINEDEEQKGEYISEINQRFTQPLLPIIFSLIAVSSMLRGSFSRNGNIKNIIFAIINAVIFISINLTLYDLIESSSNYIPLLYINFIFFTILSIVIMSSNYRKIK